MGSRYPNRRTPVDCGLDLHGMDRRSIRKILATLSFNHVRVKSDLTAVLIGRVRDHGYNLFLQAKFSEGIKCNRDLAGLSRSNRIASPALWGGAATGHLHIGNDQSL